MINYKLPITSHELRIMNYESRIMNHELRITSHESRVTSHESRVTNHELKRVCEDFEAIFLYYILKEMRKTIPKTGFIHGGRAEEFFQEMLDEKLASQISRTNSIGLANILYEQLTRETILKK